MTPAEITQIASRMQSLLALGAAGKKPELLQQAIALYNKNSSNVMGQDAWFVSMAGEACYQLYLLQRNTPNHAVNAIALFERAKSIAERIPRRTAIIKSCTSKLGLLDAMLNPKTTPTASMVTPLVVHVAPQAAALVDQGRTTLEDLAKLMTDFADGAAGAFFKLDRAAWDVYGNGFGLDSETAAILRRAFSPEFLNIPGRAALVLVR